MTGKIQKRWTWKEQPDIASVAELSTQLNNLDHVLTSVLIQRGINSFDKAKAFFRPDIKQLHDPFLMKDMDIASSRVVKALQQNEKIMIYGDYDVDGTTSVATMYLFLKDQEANVGYYIPDRYKEGYGVSEAGVRHIAGEGYTLMITLDCGIKAHQEIELANELGLDVIVCDHHTPDESLPNAVAILDQKRPDCAYPDKNLCGCGVGFKLIQAISKELNLSDEHPLSYLDLVAVAIGADIVPLVGENRILAFHGLNKLNADPGPGLSALVHHAQYDKPALGMTDVVFGIAPRINAAGRIESGASAVKLLTMNDAIEAIEFGKDLNRYNQERKDLDKTITEQALQIIRSSDALQAKKTNVLYDPEWHKGVIGIVASRVQQEFYKPTIIFTKSGDVVAGSARSVNGFNVYDAIDACSDLLIQFGGHKYAAGMTIEETNVDAFIEKFELEVATTIEDEMLIPEVKIDHELRLDQISDKFFRVQRQLEPFGPENWEPTYSSKDCLLKYPPRIVGNDHLKLTVFQEGGPSFDAIGFNLGSYFDELDEGVPFEIAYHIDENTWNGRTTLQLRLKAIRV